MRVHAARARGANDAASMHAATWRRQSREGANDGKHAATWRRQRSGNSHDRPTGAIAEAEEAEAELTRDERRQGRSRILGHSRRPSARARLFLSVL